ncbi:MAG: transposase [Bacteroidaceae bacterium]|nr:transposase [Bacteroidaceae bacterium]
MVIHSQTEMLRQRIYQIMAGFEDADNCDRLCRDGILHSSQLFAEGSLDAGNEIAPSCAFKS